MLPKALVTFRRRHPEVGLRFLEVEPEDGLPAVRAGELDLAVAHRYAGLPTPDLHALELHELFAEPLLLAHQGGDGAAVSLGDFADADWITTVPAGGFQAVTELACRAAGFEPRAPYRADDYAVVRHLVGAGLGVALVPALAALPADGVCYCNVRAPHTPVREVFAVVRQADPSPAVADMLHTIRRACDGARRFAS